LKFFPIKALRAKGISIEKTRMGTGELFKPITGQVTTQKEQQRQLLAPKPLTLTKPPAKAVPREKPEIKIPPPLGKIDFPETGRKRKSMLKKFQKELGKQEKKYKPSLYAQFIKKTAKKKPKKLVGTEVRPLIKK